MLSRVGMPKNRSVGHRVFLPCICAVALTSCNTQKVEPGNSSGDSDGTTESDTGSSAGDGSETDTGVSREDIPPEAGTWEGLLSTCTKDGEPPPQHSFFTPCGSSEKWRLVGSAVAPISGCAEVWAIVNGTVSYSPGVCSPYHGENPYQKVLEATALLDARLCVPSDCGGTPPCDPEAFHCVSYGSCSPILQDCPDGERCVTLRHELDIKPPTGKCVETPQDPALVGEPCMVGTWSEPDDCDRGLLCVPLTDGDPTGVCRAFCDPESILGPPCGGNCSPCPTGTGLCFEDCPECEAVPYC